jgi:glycosyltransferase involved in cell wall biosynthesis
MINDWFGASALAAGRYPFVICPYPYLAPWLRDIPNEKIVYYNLDEYTLYNPSRAKLIRVQEDNLVSRSALVLCLAQHQVAALRKRHPEKAESIVHFPLGVDEAYILPDPKLVATANIVGYIGNLTDRVDWRFVAEVAERSPQAVFVFVGELVAGEDGRDKRWRDMRAEVLSRPNVRHYGLVDQQEVAPLYWSFAVNWMPYDVPHPFNVASCPTKIMDSIAAGRPFISTAIPEVELYPDQIWIARSAREAAELISGFLGGSLAHDMVGQLAFARNNTWRHRATELRRLLAALRPNSY